MIWCKGQRECRQPMFLGLGARQFVEIPMQAIYETSKPIHATRSALWLTFSFYSDRYIQQQQQQQPPPPAQYGYVPIPYGNVSQGYPQYAPPPQFYPSSPQMMPPMFFPPQFPSTSTTSSSTSNNNTNITNKPEGGDTM